jgi:hypothetical protein
MLKYAYTIGQNGTKEKERKTVTRDENAVSVTRNSKQTIM